MALKKWSGTIGYQPVVVKTDHKSLEHWKTEHVDTPSGPAGRRARWHEILSRFDVSVVYNPGKNNLEADTFSRFVYPASKGLADVSKHGNLEATKEAQEIIKEEEEEEEAEEEVQNSAPKVGKISLQDEPPVLLDLFSGTGSVGKVYQNHGFHVVSVDSNNKFHPTICEDILTWDYKKVSQKGIFIQFSLRFHA